MRLTRLLTSIPAEANVLASASLALLLLKILVFNFIPAKFTGAYELGLVAESVLGSIVASYAFFVVVVHYRDKRDQARVQPYVSKHVERLSGNCQLQLNAISTATKVQLDLQTVSPAEIELAFSKLSPYGDAPMIIFSNTTANWLQYLEHFVVVARRTVGRLFIQLPFMEAELVRLLAAIDDCNHFDYFQNMGSQTLVRNNDLTSWAPAFHEYCVACRHLAQFASTRLECRSAP